jgi:hypothetical protein
MMAPQTDDLFFRAMLHYVVAVLFSTVALWLVWSAFMFAEAFGYAVQEGVELSPAILTVGPYLRSAATVAAAPLVLGFRAFGGPGLLEIFGAVIGMSACIGSGVGLIGAWAVHSRFRRVAWVLAQVLAACAAILFALGWVACERVCYDILSIMPVAIVCSVAFTVVLAKATFPYLVGNGRS